MTDTLSKPAIRRNALAVRDSLEPGAGDAENAADYFLETLQLEPSQIIALYAPKGKELDTLPLLKKLLQTGYVCGLPVVAGTVKLLKFARYREGDALQSASFGVTEPVIHEKTLWLEPDIFVVPFLAADRRGHRLGYGAGYYDATLKHYRARKMIVAVGFGYQQQMTDFNLPAESHDEKLDWIITPERALRCDG